jgi:4-diphosphocytidyl-2-C-methyl-D-erythritol kinase
LTPTPGHDAPRATIRVAAPAKLNLYLHVVGRRTDGYHLLDSLIAFAALHDTLEISAGGALHLALDGPFGARLAGEPDNLVLRAARALAQARGSAPEASIRLIKRLPPASGIGGGSADAAAALKALDRLWRLDLPQEALARIALTLGADVPMCLRGRAAFAGGAGERLDAAPLLPEAGLLLVNPGIALPTSVVFQAWHGEFGAPARFSEAPVDAASLANILAGRRNDLTEAAIALCPPIGEVLASLAAVPACRLARMSGSGATCFGLFDDAAAAAKAAPAIADGRPGWWVVATRLLSESAGLSAD